jgi:hypothetical protein
MRSVVLLTLLFFSLNTNAQEAGEYTVYFLKKGDTISDVLWRKNAGRLYGKDGLVNKTLDLNRLSDGTVKSLDPGVPVILPIKNENVAKKEQAYDEVSKKYSALLLSNVNAHAYELKRHNVKVHADYFYRTTKLPRNLKATSFQNFGAGAAYDGRYLFDYKGFAFSPKASGYMYAQNSVSFEGKSELSANMKPSFNMKLGLNASKENIPVNLGVFNEIQTMSFVTVENNDYTIVRKSTNYAGLNINHERFFLERLWSVDFNIGLNFGNAWKWDAAFATQLNRDFDIGLFYESLTDNNEQMEGIQSSGLRLIYRL